MLIACTTILISQVIAQSVAPLAVFMKGLDAQNFEQNLQQSLKVMPLAADLFNMPTLAQDMKLAQRAFIKFYEDHQRVYQYSPSCTKKIFNIVKFIDLGFRQPNWAPERFGL